MQTITVDGVRFRVALEGPENSTRPDALELAGLQSRHSGTRRWPPSRSSTGCLRYDHRGHGKTDAPEGPYSFARLAEDAVGLLDCAGDRGRRMGAACPLGGMTGMRMLTHHRERIDRVVLAILRHRWGLPRCGTPDAANAREAGMAALAEATIARLVHAGIHRNSSPAVWRSVRDMILTTPVEGYAGCCGAIPTWTSARSIAEGSNPTLVVIGARDPATYAADGETDRERPSRQSTHPSASTKVRAFVSISSKGPEWPSCRWPCHGTFW